MSTCSVFIPRLPLAPVLARPSPPSSLAIVFGCSFLDSRSLRSSLVPRHDPHSRSSSGVHASTPARSGPRSSLATILTRDRLRVFMPRLPLAPVLARPSPRSSLAIVFGCSCLDSRSLRSSLVPRHDPHSRSSSGVHASTPARSGPRSSLATILTRDRLRVFMPRLPLAPVLARPSPRSSLAILFRGAFLVSRRPPPTILTRDRLRVFIPRLPLAPVLARPSPRSSLAIVFGCSCLDSRSLPAPPLPPPPPSSPPASG